MEKYKSNLKEIRQAAGLTIEQVADGTGLAKGTILNIENEDGSNPSLGTLKRLLSYLNISLDELYP